MSLRLNPLVKHCTSYCTWVFIVNNVMADDNFRCEVVSTFFRDTCIRQQLRDDNIAALQLCAVTQASHLREQDGSAVDPVLTGSVAEFYIHPMSSCVGDLDIMHRQSDALAIPEGTAPPTHLPAEFHSRVEVYDIIADSEFPGYVYLESSYLLTECTNDGKYDAVQCQRRYVGHHDDVGEEWHGPAVVFGLPERQLFVGRASESHNSSDCVPCMQCLSWPPQAADWPTRHRNYGWPDSATVEHVVSDGCYVVGVAHRQCRQDEWKNQHQRRLSVSRAEIVLLNSWMPEQQIVYHMLRYFVKKQQLTDIEDDSGAKILSNYNLKTMMLWACEQKPKSWWTGDLNVVGICVELLHILAVCLSNARCEHYFVNDCNLFDFLVNSHVACPTADELQSVTEAWLAEWFVHNYLARCAQQCPPSCLFDNACTNAELEEAVSEIVEWQRLSSSGLSYDCFSAAEYLVIDRVSLHDSLDERLCLFWMTELAKLDRDLCHYFTAVSFLHVAYKTTGKSLEDHLLDVLATTCLQSSDLRRCRNARHSSMLSLSQAAMLMKVLANNPRSTVQLIEIELSKAYLYRALR